MKKLFIAAPEYKEIMADAGHIAWSMGKYSILPEDKEYKSIHPSLQRQSLLNMNHHSWVQNRRIIVMR